VNDKLLLLGTDEDGDEDRLKWAPSNRLEARDKYGI
jgi:hypothetical protein